MKINNPNKIWKLLNESGYTKKEAARLLDFITSSEQETREEPVPPSVREFITSEGDMPWRKREFLSQLRSFARELSNSFEKAFEEALVAYRERYPALLGERTLAYLRSNRNLLRPELIIADSEHAKNILDKFDLGWRSIDEKNFLFVFQLPKPLAKFWWKSNRESRNDKLVDVKYMVTAWGILYRKMMHVVWDLQRQYENKKGLLFYRINDMKNHDPDKYYYVWEISESDYLRENV